MKVFVASSSPALARAVQVDLTYHGMLPTSTWPYEEPSAGRASARYALDTVDQQIAESAVLLVLDPGPLSMLRLGQAIEFHLSAIVVASAESVGYDVYRDGIHVVPSQAEALALLGAWKKRLGAIPDQFARQAIWKMLHHDALRAADQRASG